MGFWDRLFSKAQERSDDGRESERVRDPASAYEQHDIRVELPAILGREFGRFTVRTAVTASDLGLSGYDVAKPFDYCLYNGSVPVAVIMLTAHNRDRNRAFLTAKAVASGLGLPFINFYTHFENNPQYVIDRIHGFIDNR